MDYYIFAKRSAQNDTRDRATFLHVQSFFTFTFNCHDLGKTHTTTDPVVRGDTRVEGCDNPAQGWAGRHNHVNQGSTN